MPLMPGTESTGLRTCYGPRRSVIGGLIKSPNRLRWLAHGVADLLAQPLAQPLALVGSRRNRRAENYWPDESDPSLPSELVQDLDPSIEHRIASGKRDPEMGIPPRKDVARDDQ